MRKLTPCRDMPSSKPLLEVCVVSLPVEPGVQAASMKSDKNGTDENFMGMDMVTIVAVVKRAYFLERL